jgi:hypothetical protein
MYVVARFDGKVCQVKGRITTTLLELHYIVTATVGS